ncbi:AAA family ATPase [Streptomyces sp. NPDC008343]|uniref:helix-turn-helix transcriptional regulator n=1 Tax=Streptomyces sp. NPDC008343 TaxID=3364828 RepID=UPI0036E85DC0
MTAERNLIMVAHSEIVGRSDELAQLAAAAETVRSRGAQIFFLSGPAGIGKTALTQAFCSTLPDFRLLSVSGVPTERYIKYAAVNRVIQAAHSGQSLDLRRMTLVQENSTVMAAGGALIDVLDDFRENSPLVFVLEDAHFVDTYSLRALGFSILRMTHDQIMAVINTEHVRQTKKDMGFTGSLEYVSQIELEGLSVSSVRDYLTSRGFPVPSETQLLQICKWSNGNPLYVQALLGAMGDGATPERLPLIDVPPSLAEAVLEWMQAFPEGSRNVLEVMAVLNAPASVPVLQGMTKSEDILGDIEPLVTEGAARWCDETTEARLELMHPGQRDALYSAIPVSKRRKLHQTAAETLDSPMRWRHRVAATATFDARLAFELSEAAERELIGGDLSNAAQFELAVSTVSPEAATRQSALLRAVRLLVLGGQYAPALAYASRVEACSASPQRHEALGFLEYARGNDASASEYLRMAQDSFRGEDDVARVASELATLQRSLGLGEQSVRSAQTSLALSSDPAIIGEAQANIAYGAALIQGPAEALRRLSHLRDNPTNVALVDLDSLVCRGICRGLSGQLVDALSDLRVVARKNAPSLARRSDFAAKVHAASCHFLLGEWEESRRVLSLAFDEAQVSGRDIDFAVLHSMSATVYACEGKWAEAAYDLGAAENISQGADFSGPDFHALQSRASVAFAREDWRTAVTLLRRAGGDSANAGRIRLYSTWFLPLLGVSCAHTRNYVLAAETLSKLDDVEPTGALPVVARNWVRGNLLHARGDTQLAVRAFRDGLAEPSFGGEPALHRSLLRCDLGRALIDLGEKLEAQRHLKAAEREFRGMGAEPFVARCLALLDKNTRSGGVTEAERLWGELTDREKDTAKLVARGWTNKEIAEELYVSTKTVEYHLGNMYAKGGLRNRRQLRNLVQELRT